MAKKQRDADARACVCTFASAKQPARRAHARHSRRNIIYSSNGEGLCARVCSLRAADSIFKVGCALGGIILLYSVAIQRHSEEAATVVASVRCADDAIKMSWI